MVRWPRVIDAGRHADFVDGWLARAAKEPSPDVLLALLEAALGALRARTVTTLGEVTLTAIAERVLYVAAERFPVFSALVVDPAGGISFRELRKRTSSMRDARLMEGIRFMLVELLTVLGNLTAEILTPELHAELGSLALPQPVGIEKVARRNVTGGKGKKS